MEKEIEEEEEEEAEVSLEELGIDSRLVRALVKKGITKPTPIQRKAIPLIFEGKDVVARAKTGSGKTFAYLLPMLQKLFCGVESQKASSPSSLILVPTRELCEQVFSEATSLLEMCRVHKKIVQLTSSMPASEMNVALSGQPEVVVSTPACISMCMSRGTLPKKSIQDSLSMLVLDEADLLLSYGYEDDLKSLVSYVPRCCQCLLMSATSSSDVEKLKKLVLHNPVILTLLEDHLNDEIFPKSVQQFWISCSARDKQLYMLSLLKLELVQKKVLIYVNSIDTGVRVRLFLEQFGIRSALLNAELPQNSRIHILEEFNAGFFDYLIATDDSQLKEKEQAQEESQMQSRKSKKHLRKKLDTEFGVVRGIDFKGVFTVINFDMPQTSTGYLHRIGRTGRANNTGASISIVSPEEEKIFDKIKQLLGEDGDGDISKYISPFPSLTRNAVESLRYRAEDVSKSVTKIAVRESRAQDLRNEILNSEKLKAHFEKNPKDLDLLKHDKLLSKKAPPLHLRDVPEYLVDPTTQEASKYIKLSRAAMGIDNRKCQRRPKRLFDRSIDPLKKLSVMGKKWHKGGRKRKENRNISGRRNKKKAGEPF